MYRLLYMVLYLVCSFDIICALKWVFLKYFPVYILMERDVFNSCNDGSGGGIFWKRYAVVSADLL